MVLVYHPFGKMQEIFHLSDEFYAIFSLSFRLFPPL